MIQSASHPVLAILEMHVLVFHKITGYSELERTRKDHRVQIWVSYQNLPITEVA